MMIFTNLCIKKGKVTRNTAENFALVLAPFAPHLAEEFGKYLETSPASANRFFLRQMKHIFRRIRLTIRYPLMASSGSSSTCLLSMQANEAEQAVKEYPQSKKYLEGKQIKKIIFVQGKIINVVVG